MHYLEIRTEEQIKEMKLTAYRSKDRKMFDFLKSTYMYYFNKKLKLLKIDKSQSITPLLTQCKQLTNRSAPQASFLQKSMKGTQGFS